RVLDRKLPSLEQALAAAHNAGNVAAAEQAKKSLQTNRTLHFNWMLDSAVTAIFLVMVVSIVSLSAREWILLLARRKLAVLREAAPVWLPDYAIAEGRPLHLFNLFALAMALAKELSGENDVQRAQPVAVIHPGDCVSYGNGAIRLPEPP